MNIQNISIIGSGQMGSGIAQTFALHGYSVNIIDNSIDSINLSKKFTDKFLKKKASDSSIINNIIWSTDYSLIKTSDLIIEAVPENEKLKKDIFKSIVPYLKKNAIVASNTSSISITSLANSIEKPELFIGIHFMNPVPVMKLVEIISGHFTSKETCNIIKELILSIKKEYTISQDYPGFIANRILMPMINEAFFVLQENIASKEDIDKTMILGTRHPMGPLKLADFIGLDTCLYIMQVLHKEIGDDKYRPSPLLQKYVNSGSLGMKNKKGVYIYE